MLAGILGRGVNGDASLYSFPVTLGSLMLRKTCLLSRGILPVCIAFGGEGWIEHQRGQLVYYVRPCRPTGVADHLVFVCNVLQPPPAIKPCNLETSEDRLRLSKLSLGEEK